MENEYITGCGINNIKLRLKLCLREILTGYFFAYKLYPVFRNFYIDLTFNTCDKITPYRLINKAALITKPIGLFN